MVEHIAWDGGDKESMQPLYAALRPGGRLIVTMPADRRYWLEYRHHHYYNGLSGPSPISGKCYSQPHYDEESARAGLTEPMASGPEYTIDDPRPNADDYQRFDRWSSMPGFDVCGLVIDKPPLHGRSTS